MLSDARDLGDGESLEADVCVVGAGAAGITLARELRGSGLRIVMLESGGLEPDDEVQGLYAGEVAGREYFDLDVTRLRYFGGSTNHWHGWCRPLEPIDLEARDAVPESGWPIAYDELAAHYERAQDICELGPFAYGGDDWAEAADAQVLPLASDRLSTQAWQFSPPTRFGQAYRDDIAGADDVACYLHANLVDLEVDGERVRTVRAATLDGTAFTVEAEVVVLATGGIENARLLLASRAGRGIGGDAVGRYFTEHPHLRAGVALVPRNERLLGWYLEQVEIERVAVRAALAPSDEVVRSEGLVRASVWFDPWKDRPQPPSEEIERIGRLASAVGAPETRPVEVYVRSEQAPNPDSRVRLGGERDALGLPRPVLEWRLRDLDTSSVRRSLEIVGEELGAAGLGRVFLRSAVGDEPDISGGHHHMGTTRMGEDPSTSVVDADGRLHGTDNLYVAGSSVFPSAGFANPTLTVVALALRLAGHLGEELGAR